MRDRNDVNGKRMKNNENSEKKLNIGKGCVNKGEKRTESSEKVGETRRKSDRKGKGKRDECTKLEKEEAQKNRY